MNPRYAQVALRAGHCCEYCHAPETVFNLPFEVEHIIPVSREGIDLHEEELLEDWNFVQTGRPANKIAPLE